MPLFLLYRTAEADRNSSGVDAVLIDAADESAARSRARAVVPTGET